MVDLLGFPVDLPRLSAVADEFGLTLIEDAAQALGSSLGHARCGSFGKVAALSFNNNKIITSNGGGAILTNDEWVAAKAWQLATTARVPHPWKVEHDAIGFNYRMPAINATLGYSQFQMLDKFLELKRRLLSFYQTALKELPLDVLVAKEPWQGEPNYWLITAVLREECADQRDVLLQELHARGIQARALFTPLHTLPMYADCPRDSNLQSAETTFDRAICLPSGVALG